MISKALQVIQFAQAVGNMLPRPAPEYQEAPIPETDRMDGMATLSDLERFRYKPDAFYLGRIHPEHGTNFQAGIDDDRHGCVVAQSRSGKGTSFFVSNALRWGDTSDGGGLICLDPKGEIASITAIRRGKVENAKGTGTSVRTFIGRDVAILDPLGLVKGPARKYCVRYNPLSAIDIKSRDALERIKSIAEGLILPEPGQYEHFSLMAEVIVCGVIEYLFRMEKKSNQNLVFMRSLLKLKFEDLIALLEKCPDQEGYIGEAISGLEEAIGSDEASGFKTTLTKNLTWMVIEDMRDHLASSDVSLEKIVQERGSVYIVVPPKQVEKYASWVRVVIQQAIDAKTALGTEQRTKRTLFLVDEFPLLGRFKIMERGCAYLAGYNIKFVWAVQQISQLKTLYEKNWEAFFGNSGVIIIFATNDGETEEYLSSRMSKVMKWQTSLSISSGANYQALSGGGSDGKTTSSAQHLQAVRLASEIHEEGARETGRAFIIPADAKTFTVQRQEYYKNPVAGLFDSPDFCLEWERKYGGQI